jgi:hypothetical protein
MSNIPSIGIWFGILLRVVLPVLMVLITLAWLIHRGIIQLAPRRPPRHTPPVRDGFGGEAGGHGR